MADIRRPGPDADVATALGQSNIASAVSRRVFFGAGASVAAVGIASRVGAQNVTGDRTRVLVLSGGIAYGSYEAGVLSALAQAHGGPRSYDFVCGTSIGALNGAVYCAGSASELAALWNSIGSRAVLKVKDKYAKIPRESAGVANRLYQLGRLVYDMATGDGQGVCDSEPVQSILREFLVLDGKVRPFRLPLFWAATDVTAGTATYFKRLSNVQPREQARATVSAVSDWPGIQFETPEGPDQFIEALRSSSAFPIVFDPAKLGGAARAKRILVDGGVLNNTPFRLVRIAVAQGPVDVDVVLLGPDFAGLGPAQSRNALGLLGGLFDAVRQQQSDDAVRSLKYEVQAANPRGRPVSDSVTISMIRPSKALAGNSFDFTDQASITANFKLGQQDVQTRGFTPYKVPDPFETSLL